MKNKTIIVFVAVIIAITVLKLKSCSLPTSAAHTFNVYSIVFLHGSNVFLSASGDGFIKLWNIHGKLLKSFPHQDEQIRKIDISPDNKFVISSDDNNNISIWSINGELLKKMYKVHSMEIRFLKFNPQGNLFYSGGEDDKIRIWNLKGDLLKTINFSGDLLSLDFIGKSPYILFTCDDEINLADNNFKSILKFKEPNTTFYNVKYYDTSHIIASNYSDLYIFNNKLELLKKIKAKNEYDWIGGINCLTNTKRIITNGEIIKIWDLNGNIVDKLKDHFLEVDSLSLNETQNIFVTGSTDFSIKIWKINGTLVKTIWNLKHLRRFIWKYNPLDQWR